MLLKGWLCGRYSGQSLLCTMPPAAYLGEAGRAPLPHSASPPWPGCQGWTVPPGAQTASFPPPGPQCPGGPTHHSASWGNDPLRLIEAREEGAREKGPRVCPRQGLEPRPLARRLPSLCLPQGLSVQPARVSPWPWLPSPSQGQGRRHCDRISASPPVLASQAQ